MAYHPVVSLGVTCKSSAILGAPGCQVLLTATLMALHNLPIFSTRVSLTTESFPRAWSPTTFSFATEEGSDIILRVEAATEGTFSLSLPLVVAFESPPKLSDWFA